MTSQMLSPFLDALTAETDTEKQNLEWVAAGLQEVAKRCDTRDIPLLEELGKSGLMHSIIQALRWAGLSAEAAEPALKALTYLCRNPQNKQVVVASGGRELVMAVLKRHSLSAAVALAGCGVVVNTSAEEVDQLALGKLGACEEMVKCLRAHRLNVDVTWMALAGLVNMTIAEENQVRFGESGGIRMVSNALGAHRTSTRICQVGCRILRNLAASPANHERMVADGVVSTLMLALNTHKDDPDVALGACGTMANLAINTPAKEAAIQQHAPEMMKAVAAKHKSVKAVKVQANNAYKLLTGSATPRSGGRKFSLFGKTLTIGGSK